MTFKLITLTTKEDIELIVDTYNKNPTCSSRRSLSVEEFAPVDIKYLELIETIVQLKIEALVTQHDPIAAKLEVIKELFLKHRTHDGQAYVTAVRDIRTLTGCSLKNARTIVDSWVREIMDRG